MLALWHLDRLDRLLKGLNEEQTQHLYQLYDDTNPDGRKKYTIKESARSWDSQDQRSIRIWVGERKEPFRYESSKS